MTIRGAVTLAILALGCDGGSSTPADAGDAATDTQTMAGDGSPRDSEAVVDTNVGDTGGGADVGTDADGGSCTEITEGTWSTTGEAPSGTGMCVAIPTGITGRMGQRGCQVWSGAPPTSDGGTSGACILEGSRCEYRDYADNLIVGEFTSPTTGTMSVTPAGSSVTCVATLTRVGD